MKKLILSIAFLAYLALSTGVVMSFHYCMDKLASTELFARESTSCGKCGMHTKASHGCCRDEVKIVKMQTDQKPAVEFSWKMDVPVTGGILPSSFLSLSLQNAPLQGSFQQHPPPLLTEQDTYLRHCVFRI